MTRGRSNRPRSYRIILVDDEVATLEYYAAVLETLGHTVTTRSSALGTAPVIIKERPDFVFLDVEMPGLPGHEIVRVLSRRQGAARTRFVLLSSKPERELRALAEACGADGYLCKTSNRKQLGSELARIFARLAPAAPP